MRGRSLRLDPADPAKVASNWDVVCVAPDLVRGSADYERFVRKHLHLYAPAEDGEIEAGPVARAPRAGAVRAAAGERFARAQRARMLARAGDRDAARERWRIGTPYRGVELPTLVRPPAARRDAGAATAAAPADAATSPSGSRSPPALGGARGVRRSLGVAASAPPLLAGLALAPGRAGLGGACGCGRAKRAAAARAPARPRRARGRRRLPGAGRAVGGGRRVAGDRAARRRLPALRADRRRRRRRARGFAAALDELIGVVRRAALPRLAPARRARRAARSRLLGRVLRAPRRRSPRACIPCRPTSARSKERAEAFARAWRR